MALATRKDDTWALRAPHRRKAAGLFDTCGFYSNLIRRHTICGKMRRTKIGALRETNLAAQLSLFLLNLAVPLAVPSVNGADVMATQLKIDESLEQRWVVLRDWRLRRGTWG